MLKSDRCNICPRKCNVYRLQSKGFCGVSGEKMRVGRVSLHHWEEPCISGTNGSGTIFFGGCNLKCIYCQNKILSQGNAGKSVTQKQLVDAMLRLQERGAHNINFVTPTHYADHVISLVKQARSLGLAIPIVYNTSGYESVETISKLKGTISIYLTDFKYSDDSLAQKYSGVSDYTKTAFDALLAMCRQIDKNIFNRDEIMQQGIIVRHLVLPGQVENSKKVLKLLYDQFGNSILYSIMNQYTPIENLQCDELYRQVTSKEYDEVINYALDLGICNAYIQDGDTQKESFIPLFDGEGI